MTLLLTFLGFLIRIPVFFGMYSLILTLLGKEDPFDVVVNVKAFGQLIHLSDLQTGVILAIWTLIAIFVIIRDLFGDKD